MKKKGYSSDLTPEQFEKIRVHLPQKKQTAPRKIEQHDIVNGIMYQLKNGCIWKDLPNDLPNCKTVFHYFTLWKKEGVWDKVLDELNIENRLAVEKKTSKFDDR
jgi:transposase